jgi:aminoglycoside phosphotransferase (APT) family kinase protein
VPDGVTSPPHTEIQVGVLADWLAAQTGADRVHIDPLVLLPGGAVQQNWALDVEFAGGELPGRQELVLRANFQTPLPASRPKAEEYAVLRAVAAAGVAVPETLWLCQDRDIIGQPFFVMRRLPGDASARALIAAAARDGFGPELTGQLARELALVHTLSPDDRRLTCLGPPPASPALAQLAQCRDWLTRLEGNCNILSVALDWLQRHAPRPGEIGLVHRDFRSGNILVDKGRLTAVLDWEFAGWGDPHEDIGWFCAACWRAGRDDLEAGGLAPRDAFYRTYEAAGGRPVDAQSVAYWEIMAHLRWVLIARQQGARARQGDIPQHELLEAAARVPDVERNLAAMIAKASLPGGEGLG